MPIEGIASLADIVRVHGGERARRRGPRRRRAGDVPSASSTTGRARPPRPSGPPGWAGDRVAFIDKNGAEWFEVTFGLAKLGAVNVSVNWRLAPPEMAQIIDDAAGRGRDRRARVRRPHREDRGRARGACTRSSPSAATTAGRLRRLGRRPARPRTRRHRRRATTWPSSSTRRAPPGCPRA